EHGPHAQCSQDPSRRWPAAGGSPRGHKLGQRNQQGEYHAPEKQHEAPSYQFVQVHAFVAYETALAPKAYNILNNRFAPPSYLLRRNGAFENRNRNSSPGNNGQNWLAP